MANRREVLGHPRCRLSFRSWSTSSRSRSCLWITVCQYMLLQVGRQEELAMRGCLGVEQRGLTARGAGASAFALHDDGD